MKIFKTVFLLQLAASFAIAGLSAERGRNEDWRAASSRVSTLFFSSGSVFSSRVRSKELDLSELVPVSQEQVDSFFLTARETLVHQDEQGRHRRLTWLFPDDGCFARAQWVGHLLSQQQIPEASVAKIYAFGNLRAVTPNHPFGEVSWWYHVAVLIKTVDEAYVIDPAIDPRGPLLAEQWLARIGAVDAVNVCHRNSYDPHSPCAGFTTSPQVRGERDQREFFPREERRLSELGRDVEAELGDWPPWRGSQGNDLPANIF